MDDSGDTDPVWAHTEPRLERPYFSQLGKDLQTDVCVIGSGIAGISTAYELVTRGIHVVMVEGRELLSGESGRTGGHLSNVLDSGYRRIASKHGDHGAQIAADSHSWAIRRVHDVSRRLGVECEYRQLPCYKISQYQQTDDRHQEEVRQLREEATKAKMFNLSVSFREGYAIRGWDGAPNQRDAAVYEGQAVFHPIKYMVGVLTWLKNQPNFACYTLTRVVSIEERVSRQSGKDSKHVCVYTERGYTIACNDAVEATCEPCFRRADILAQLDYTRTYCIAIRVPKGTVEDCLVYDLAKPYKYIRLTSCDETDEYLIVGGCDHEVRQVQENGGYAELETWVRERFTKAGPVDFRWSGKVFESVDYVSLIGHSHGKKHTYMVTGDCGNGLTHGVLAGKLIADEIQGLDNPWRQLYEPRRFETSH